MQPVDNSHNLHQWLHVKSKTRWLKLCWIIFPTLASVSILFRFFMQNIAHTSGLIKFPCLFSSRSWFSLSESGGDHTSLQPFSADKHTKTGRKTRSIMAEKSRLCNIIMSLAQPQVHIYAGIWRRCSAALLRLLSPMMIVCERAGTSARHPVGNAGNNLCSLWSCHYLKQTRADKRACVSNEDWLS